MPSRVLLAFAGVLAPAFLFAAPVQAQSLARVLACQDIARAEERLACYDSAARTAIGLGASIPRNAESELARRSAELDAREAKLLEREALVKRLEASARNENENPGPSAKRGIANREAPSRDLAMLEAEFAKREAAIKAREERLAALPAAKAEEEATLFGIPIPFTRRDTFSQQADENGVNVERNADGGVDAIRASIREWSTTGDGTLIFVLENGQVWRQTEGSPLRLRDDPKNPNIARISRAAFGSFMLTVNDSAKSIKVRRVDGKKPKS